MAFEQVLLRYPDGQEFGPASWEQLVQWRMDGRVPDNAIVVDAVSGETQAVTAFAQLAVLAPPPVMPPVANTSGTTVTDHLIPVKNPASLVAYYCGVFGLIPCATPLLGPASLIAGIIGMRQARERAVGFTHSLTGIILGSLETIAMVIGIYLLVRYARY